MARTRTKPRKLIKVPTRSLYDKCPFLLIDIAAAAPAPPTPIEKADSQGAEQDEEDAGPKLLSKKEKEKLKKEREKV